MGGKPGDERIEASIIGYLEDNPDAMDSLAGIAEFWVMHQRVRTEVMDLAGVLERLVTRGVLEQIGEGPSALYRLKGAPAGGGGKPIQQ